MGNHELANEEKTRARVGPDVFSENGKGKVVEPSSEMLIALEERKHDWLTKYVCEGEESHAERTFIQNILG